MGACTILGYEKSQFIAINSRLEQPLDEQDDPGFLFAQWTDEDEAFKVSRTRPEDGAPATGEASGRTKFFCWEEQWELEARKDTPVNIFKVQDKFLGMYLFKEDPEDYPRQQGGREEIRLRSPLLLVSARLLASTGRKELEVRIKFGVGSSARLSRTKRASGLKL